MSVEVPDSTVEACRPSFAMDLKFFWNRANPKGHAHTPRHSNPKAGIEASSPPPPTPLPAGCGSHCRHGLRVPVPYLPKHFGAGRQEHQVPPQAGVPRRATPHTTVQCLGNDQ